MTNQGFYDLEFVALITVIIVGGTWVSKQVIELISFLIFKIKIKRKIRKEFETRGKVNVKKLK